VADQARRKKKAAAKSRARKPPRSKAARSTATSGGSASRPASSGDGTSAPSAAQRRRAERVYARLRELYPDAECALKHRNAFELLVATILSAQCTDARVNMVTPELFKRFPDPQTMAGASQPQLEALIRSTGFYRNKARNLKAMSERLVDEFNGRVPDIMDDLLTLPGVARKTANVVLGNVFGINVGVVVDTHVGRLSRRLGFTTHNDPKKVEQDLVALFPRETWTLLAHLLIFHGRQVCAARKPLCERCALFEDCPRVGVAEGDVSGSDGPAKTAKKKSKSKQAKKSTRSKKSKRPVAREK